MPPRVKAPNCRKLVWARAQRARMSGHNLFGDLSGVLRGWGMPDKTMQSAYTTRPLTAETWGDFAGLVEANNGVWGGCWCMGFHPEGVGKDRTVSQNREAKHAHVREGTVHQLLVYDGDDCVGWCQYGPPAELPAIKNPKAYNAELTELPDWRIGCIFTGKGHPAQGSRGRQWPAPWLRSRRLAA